MAFGIQPKNPASVKINESGNYEIASGQSIPFRAYVTYSDDVASPEDLTAKIEGAKGWVNGPIFNKTRPGIYRVSAEFSAIGKGKITVRIIVR